MNRRIFATVALLCGLAVFSTADEGMWLFNKPPKDQLKKDHHFTVTDPWLDHLRLGSVRFNNGAPARSSLPTDSPSPIITLDAPVCSSSPPTRWITSRPASTPRLQAEEGKCPDLELDVLVRDRGRDRRSAGRCPSLA